MYRPSISREDMAGFAVSQMVREIIANGCQVLGDSVLKRGWAAARNLDETCAPRSDYHEEPDVSPTTTRFGDRRLRNRPDIPSAG